MSAIIQLHESEIMDCCHGDKMSRLQFDWLGVLSGCRKYAMHSRFSNRIRHQAVFLHVVYFRCKNLKLNFNLNWDLAWMTSFQKFRIKNKCSKHIFIGTWNVLQQTMQRRYLSGTHHLNFFNLTWKTVNTKLLSGIYWFSIVWCKPNAMNLPWRI